MNGKRNQKSEISDPVLSEVFGVSDLISDLRIFLMVFLFWSMFLSVILLA